MGGHQSKDGEGGKRRFSLGKRKSTEDTPTEQKDSQNTQQGSNVAESSTPSSVPAKPNNESSTTNSKNEPNLAKPSSEQNQEEGSMQGNSLVTERSEDTEKRNEEIEAEEQKDAFASCPDQTPPTPLPSETDHKSETGNKTEAAGVKRLPSVTVSKPRDQPRERGDSVGVEEWQQGVQWLPLKVYCGTWNVGNAVPGNLEDWLQCSEGSTNNDFDIYAVGVQECEYPPRTGYASCEEDWLDTLQKTLGPNYQLLDRLTITPQTENTFRTSKAFLQAVEEGKARQGEIRISIFVRQNLVQEISEVEKSLKTTGRLNGLSGNKGGLCISFKCGHTRLCFINSHLNAHAENMERRNEDCRNIHWGLTNGPLKDPDGAPEFDFDVASQFPYVFWFGDLNYRLDAEADQVMQDIADRNTERLLLTDQLIKEHREGRALTPFTEEPITFLPTFKVKKNKHMEYDLSQRTPSYCDRVLSRALDGYPIVNGGYSAVPGVQTSDHKPVYAVYTVHAIGAINPAARLKPGRTLSIRVSGLSAKGLLELRQGPEGATEEDARIEAPYISAVYEHEKGWIQASGLQLKPPMTFSGEPSSPVWTGDLVLEASDVTSPLGYLAHTHVWLSVRDADQRAHRLGEAAICLGHCIDFESGITHPYTFTVNLMQYGLYSGTLSGTLNITLE
eukprot:comp23970_c0_seq1/m.42504 comp23970_c0_seq1/g.42504  ORF comp23970_c0_seq1/g.42504 comp23970_c0_seq1/m.42504 type:complete len:673 (-) comp23970_c0_seq1:844-2862(-)